MSEPKFECPKCSTLVLMGDKICKNCGADLTEFWQTVQVVSATPQPPPHEAPYERKFSTIQRLLRLLTSPSETMKDIGEAPDYQGFYIIAVAAFIEIIASVSMALQKIQFVGTYAGQVNAFLVDILSISVFLGLIIYVAEWAVKSLIVKYACDQGSAWDFKTAASVTGYAYVADVVVSVLSIAVSWAFVPTFVVDTTNLTTATASISSYQGQLNLLRLEVSLPFSLLALLWKSYLGGLGTHFGTQERCSIGLGLVVFFVLGLVGIAIGFIAPT